MENKQERALFSGVIYLALILCALISASLNGMNLSAALAKVCYGIILGTVFLAVLHWKEDQIWNQIEGKVYYLLIFTISVCLIGVASRYSVGSFWMLLLVTAGCMAGTEIKVASYGILMGVYTVQALPVHEQISQLEYVLVMGIAILLIFSIIRQRQEIPYAGVVLTALCLVLLVLGTGFDLAVFWQKKYQMILEISSLIFFILFGMLVRMAQEMSWDKKAPQETLEAELMGLLQDDFVLMQQLKSREELYHHSYEISRLSGLAARTIGCDSILASAGGMYHEVGRLVSGEKYMEAGLELAEKYQFPEKLIEVIRQHNTGSEVPKSPEAAIVMLSDCIVSTGELLKKSGKREAVSDEKLVKSIFANRKAKGSLEQAGLPEEQLEQLMEYYIANTFTVK